MNISDILKNKLDTFEVIHSQTLFDIDLRVAIHQHRCPLCFNKLKIPLKGSMALCNGKKHRKPFLIGKDKLK